MATNGIIILTIIPFLIIIPILFRRRLRNVFSKSWPWVILGVLLLAYLVFVRDIPNTRHGMKIVKDPELHFDEHLNWRVIDQNIGISWEELYYGKGHIIYGQKFQSGDFNAFWSKLHQAYAAKGLALVKSDIIKGIVQSGQNQMVTNIVPADLCPFTTHLLAIAMMFKWFRKKLAAPVATWAVLGGLLTTITAPYNAFAMYPSTLSVIFGGFIGPHLLQIILGVLVLIVSPKFTWRTYVKSVMFIFIMATYISLVYWMTNITMQTTGVADGDWRDGGEFSIIPNILGIADKSIHLIRFSGWMIFISMNLIVVTIAYYAQKMDVKYIIKVPEGFIYKRYGYIVRTFQEWFKNHIKNPIVRVTKKTAYKISDKWHYFWKVEDAFRDDE